MVELDRQQQVGRETRVTLLVSDRFHSHPAVIAATPAAIGLWVRAASWSARHLTDGELPRAVVLELGAEQVAHELVHAGLWRHEPERWVMLRAVPAAPGCTPIELWRIERGDQRPRIPQWLRDLVFERDEFRCVQCAATEDLTLDHIYPWSKGGPDTEQNLRVLCRSCNSSKGARV